MYAVSKLETVTKKRRERTFKLLALTAGTIGSKAYLNSRDLI